MDEGQKQKYLDKYNKAKQKGIKFYPDIVVKDLLIAFAILLLLIGLAVLVGVKAEPKADPSDTSYIPRPEWYFLFLFQMLKYFPGQIEWIGTALIPGIAVLLLILLPFIDRNPNHHWSKRKFGILVMIAVVVGMVALTIVAVVTTPAQEETGKLATSTEEQIVVGGDLYMVHCVECHGANGEGGEVKGVQGMEGVIVKPINNPNDMYTRSDATLVEIISFGRPSLGMPPFSKAYGGELSLSDIDTIANFMLYTWVINIQPAQAAAITPTVEVAAQEPDSSIWEENFPNQYSTFLKTETNATETMFGGSNPYSKLEQDPRLIELFAGYTYGSDYNEDQGPMNSLTDVRATKRVNETTPGTCYSCKSSNNPRLWTEMGMVEYDKTPFSQLGEKITEPIGCANCHEANTMKLIVTNPALEEALKAQGLDWRTFSLQEMRTVVCANCHVEYYFKGDGNYLALPWEKGQKIEDISSYYTEIGFKDWEHGISKAPIIKIEHPDFELYTADSTHYKAGVSCADCHMPYARDGVDLYSDHNIQSPLLDPEAACSQCHSDIEYVTERVVAIQLQVRQTMDATEDAILSAVYAIQAASKAANVDQAKLDEARILHREAQIRWDFIAAENSMGFHNPEEALRILATATDLARQSQLKAIEATSTS
jgi:nitrite reductase (cytochrome c-552)